MQHIPQVLVESRRGSVTEWQRGWGWSGAHWCWTVLDRSETWSEGRKRCRRPAQSETREPQVGVGSCEQLGRVTPEALENSSWGWGGGGEEVCRLISPGKCPPHTGQGCWVPLHLIPCQPGVFSEQNTCLLNFHMLPFQKAFESACNFKNNYTMC